MATKKSSSFTTYHDRLKTIKDDFGCDHDEAKKIYQRTKKIKESKDIPWNEAYQTIVLNGLADEVETGFLGEMNAMNNGEDAASLLTKKLRAVRNLLEVCTAEDAYVLIEAYSSHLKNN